MGEAVDGTEVAVHINDLPEGCDVLSTALGPQSRGEASAPNATAFAKRMYVLVSSDFCHAGIISLLERAKQLGDCLVVGLPSDDMVAAREHPGEG